MEVRYFSASETTTPPRAVPSSLVMTRPVTPIMARNVSACAWAFCPAVASGHRRHLCGAAGGVGVLRAGDDGAPGPLAPNLELLDRGGAKSVAGSQHYSLAGIAIEL